MGHIRKKILGAIFNPLARMARVHPVDLEHLYDLFIGPDAVPKKRNIEALKKAMDDAVRDFFHLSKYVSCTRSENFFMDEFIALRMATEEADPANGYIYPHRDTIAELYDQKDGYMALAFNARYFADGLTEPQTLLEKSFASSRLQKLHERFEKFFENVGAQELSEHLQHYPYGNVSASIHDRRTWDLWLLNEGEVKIDIENVSALVHSMNTYNENPFVRKRNIRDAFDKVIEWVESYAEPSSALAEISEAFLNIQQALDAETGFYDPRYMVIHENALFKLDEHAHIFLDIAEKLREKRDRIDGLPPPGETFKSVAETLYYFGTNIPVVARQSMMTSSRRPHHPYNGPRPPQA
jgi:hypothetical protein